MMWQLYGPGYANGWGVLFLVLMLLFWLAVLGVAVYLVRALLEGRRSQGGGGAGDQTGIEPAIDILRRRLAAGEISQDEFEQIRRLLQS